MADLSIASLERLLAEARTEIGAAAGKATVEALRVKYLGKKGSLSGLLAGLRDVGPDERRALGARANQVKEELEASLSAALAGAERAALEAELARDRLDVSLPGRRPAPLGHRHPVTQTLDDLVEIFARLGFGVVHGPEVELDYYNFEALNQPPGHPARDMQDTFYVDAAPLGGRAPASPLLLRSHTSPVQIRAMLREKPPLRIISPGRVYRRDDDPTHSPMFHQIEALYVDRGVSMGDLKWTIEQLVQALFGSDFKIRLRPSFFPFVQPGAEVDMTCTLCGGKGCRTCKGTGFIEVLGAGLVHPQVLRNVGYDPEEVSGFAFGLGVDRFAMLRYGLDDLRLFFENDLRFLERF
jgi:phenylalanyl-tRNA synthetase alpha chain